MSGNEHEYMHFPNYDEEIRNILPYYDSFHEETINLVKAMTSKPAIWLDTGCGIGTFVKMALKHFPDAKFVLSDPSAEMLEDARRKLR
jgi:tRNA (cmo5U34)-methyltransferase